MASSIAGWAGCEGVETGTDGLATKIGGWCCKVWGNAVETTEVAGLCCWINQLWYTQ